ncbi:hypothetical protein ACO9S2_15505 [Nitrospira sp. NS4]|uniref:hypothetical protein n=1 Tax=Nitrospira sp. NS4 TaxID=3414498 RepID=UPI003C3099E2
MSVDADDEFQKELITLFVQEAQEWLQQIHVALDELQQGPPADRHTKLAQTMKAGLTNLGGSAAMISLSEIEQASFAALSFVEAVENPAAALSASAFLALCKQLGHIHSALTRATGVTFDAESSVCSEAVPATMSTSDLLAALQSLLSRQTGATDMARNVTRTLIAQIEGLIQTGVTECDAHSLRSFLIRVADAEQTFLDAVQQQGPMVVDGVAQMSRGLRESDGMSTGEGQALVDQVNALWAASQQVNALQAMTFFMGLQSFLTIVTQRRVLPEARQFELVEQRLRGILGQAQEWAEAGRMERDAIDALLPAV